jgi:ankyrin repeat protein
MGNSSTLPMAAANGDKDLIINLLNKGRDVNEVDDDGCTALMCAVCIGSMSVTKILLLNGADVRIKDKVIH